ncbi:unnamed protein product [Ectocarpus sp. 6 AP-2014]
MVGGLEKESVSPKKCGVFAAKGFVVGKTVKSRRKEGCRPVVSASYPGILVGPVPNASAQNVEMR